MPKQTIKVAKKKGAIYAPFCNTIIFNFIIIYYLI